MPSTVPRYRVGAKPIDRPAQLDHELVELRCPLPPGDQLRLRRRPGDRDGGQRREAVQLQRLERELDEVLLELTTHHVRLSPAGAVFLIEARWLNEDWPMCSRAAARPKCSSSARATK
jgi:hypothetical protein